jgi:hypothetical protein
LLIFLRDILNKQDLNKKFEQYIKELWSILIQQQTKMEVFENNNKDVELNKR